RPIAGTAATVSTFHRAEFVHFLGERYRPDRILVAGAGNLRHDALVDVVGTQLGPLAGSAPLVDGPLPVATSGLHVVEKDLRQVHLCFGAPGIAQMDDDRCAAHLLNSALGGGMSSRLFQEIRERQGKAYTVYSFLTSYRDSGYTGVYVGTSPEWVRDVTDCVRE